MRPSTSHGGAASGGLGGGLGGGGLGGGPGTSSRAHPPASELSFSSLSMGGVEEEENGHHDSGSISNFAKGFGFAQTAPPPGAGPGGAGPGGAGPSGLFRPSTAPAANANNNNLGGGGGENTTVESSQPSYMRSTTSSRQSRTRSGRKYADITDGMSTSIRNLKLTYASTLAPSETMEAQAAARWLALPAPTGVPESTLAPADGALFFDGHFPAGEESLYGRNATTPPGATPVAWSRLNGVLYDAKRHEHPIVRGSGLVSSAEESAPGG